MGNISQDASQTAQGAAMGGLVGGPMGAGIGAAGGLASGLLGGKGGPTPPDFNAAAQKQGVSDHPDQSSPFGYSQWRQDPTTGQWSQSTGFNGPLAGAAAGIQDQLAANAGQPLMTGEDARNQAITAAYGQATSRLDPQWSQREEQTKAELQAQGLDPSSEAYQREIGNLGRERNDAYTSAMNSAVGQGTAAQQATFGENLAAQQMPYQELAQLQGLAGQPNAPGSTQYLPAALAAYNSGLQNYSIGQQGKNSAMGGASMLAALNKFPPQGQQP